MAEVDPNSIKSTSLRAIGEADRTPEFKEARSKLISDVNEWLLGLVVKRDEGEKLISGNHINESPRVQHTDLGPTGPNTHAILESTKRGVSLTGDGVTEPIVFQWVKTDEQQASVETTDVHGNDPLANQFYGDEFSIARQQETVVSFGQSESQTHGAQYNRYFTFRVLGDGRVQQQFRRADGFNVSQELRTAQELQIAQLAFEDIARTIS